MVEITGLCLYAPLPLSDSLLTLTTPYVLGTEKKCGKLCPYLALVVGGVTLYPLVSPALTEPGVPQRVSLVLSGLVDIDSFPVICKGPLLQ